jgi:membrane peptidoglycan carboxypeptidase
LISALIGTGIIAMILALFAAYQATSLPAKDALGTAQTTVIYFNDGTTPIGQLAAQNRQIVDFNQIPAHVRVAVLAAEDHTFYTNSGVDPKSIARAIYSNVRGNSQQGGSTISQQYVKNVYDQRDHSYKRKAKEVFLAIKINRERSKDDILATYLNTIYFGRGAYGIQAAAHAYFGPKVKVEDLTVSQGAFLAGIINAPSLADPRGGPDALARATRRWGVVLDAMVTEKLLDPATRQTLKFPKTIEKPTSGITVKGQNGYLMDMAKKEAISKLGITEDQLQTGGYKIVTTFDPKMVKAAAAAVTDMLPKKTPPGLQIGLSAVDVKTGAVRAIFGGKKYVGAENNNATIAVAEAGSTFKPFGLIAALTDGASLKDKYNSKSPLILTGVKGKKSIKNYEGEQYGYIDLIDATKHSVNTVYIQMNQDHGAAATRKVAHSAGVPDSVPIEDNIANVLGSAPPHAIDMASAYATIAAQGWRRVPYTIQKVTLLGTGKVQWDMKERTAGKRVFDAGVMADTTYAMQRVIADNAGTGTYAQKLGRPAAGKTGTSSDSRSAWFVGFTPQLSTAVSMYQVGKVNGKYSNLSMDGFGIFNSIFGGGYPARIWTEFMIAASKGMPVEKFPEPVYGGDISHKAPPTKTLAPTTQPTTQPTEPPDQSDQSDQSDQPGRPTTDPTTTTPKPPVTTSAPVFTLPTTDPPGNGNGGGGGGNNDDDN